MQTENTRSVIEESKAFTTQALASVTYQINNLATSLLKLLDAQTLQLKQVESSVNTLSRVSFSRLTKAPESLVLQYTRTMICIDNTTLQTYKIVFEQCGMSCKTTFKNLFDYWTYG